MTTTTTTILGGGLSGLCSAYYLSKLPQNRVILLERSSRFGGWVRTQPNGFEAGPRSVRPVGLQGLLTLQIIDELGLAPSLVTVSKSHPAARNRYIYYPDRLHRAPNSIKSAVASSFSKTSPFTRLLPSVLSEPFRKKQRHAEDESVDSFVSRRFGASFAENVLSALVHGIYAGDTRQLSVRSVFPSLWNMEQHRGSVVLSMLSGGVKPPKAETDEFKQLQASLPELVEKMKDVSVYSLQGGLEALPRAMVKHLGSLDNVELRTDTSAKSLEYSQGSFKISTSSSDTITSDRVVSALSSTALGSLIDLPHLSHNPSVTVGVVNLAFPSSFKLPIQGFGYLIPRSVPLSQNPHRALGVVFDSDMFGAEDGQTRVTVMLGGHYWQNETPPSPEALLSGALETLHMHGIVPSTIEPIHHKAQIQENCIPQYLVGHPQRMRQLHSALLDKYDGKLGLVGSSYNGVGMNDCIKSSWDQARRQAASGSSTGLEGWHT